MSSYQTIVGLQFGTVEDGEPTKLAIVNSPGFPGIGLIQQDGTAGDSSVHDTADMSQILDNSTLHVSLTFLTERSLDEFIEKLNRARPMVKRVEVVKKLRAEFAEFAGVVS